MADLRLFIAVEMPRVAVDVLAAVARDLARAGADVKWSRPSQMHLTLKFLGDTPEEEVPALATALDAAAALSRRTTTRLTEIGAFPDVRRPRVVWAGLDEPSGELLRLQKRVEEAAAHLVPPEDRPFVPHLTLGRVRGPKNLPRLSSLLVGYRLASAVEIPIREIVLIRSDLAREGPTYTNLHHSPIGG